MLKNIGKTPKPYCIRRRIDVVLKFLNSLVAVFSEGLGEDFVGGLKCSIGKEM